MGLNPKLKLKHINFFCRTWCRVISLFHYLMPSNLDTSCCKQHRYYGKSIPFGTIEEAMNNETTRGYFNSAQALADYAEVLLYLKKKYSAQHSPIIVFGGSYGGSMRLSFSIFSIFHIYLKFGFFSRN